MVSRWQICEPEDFLCLTGIAHSHLQSWWDATAISLEEAIYASDSEIPGYNQSYSLTFFDRRLVAARKGTESISLYAYSFGSQLWTPVFQVLNSSHITADNSCATVVLSLGELMILKYSTVKLESSTQKYAEYNNGSINKVVYCLDLHTGRNHNFLT